jgi:hypothetical protein
LDKKIMPLSWTDDLAGVDRDELAALYRSASASRAACSASLPPLGLTPEDHFIRSARQGAVYECFGFRRMTTAVAIFEDPAGAHRNGNLEWP